MGSSTLTSSEEESAGGLGRREVLGSWGLPGSAYPWAKVRQDRVLALGLAGITFAGEP